MPLIEQLTNRAVFIMKRLTGIHTYLKIFVNSIYQRYFRKNIGRKKKEIFGRHGTIQFGRHREISIFYLSH